MAQDATDDVQNKPSYTGSGGVVTISGKTYAVGLIWEAVQVPGAKPLAQARAAAAVNAADMLCVRKPKMTQYGLGSRSAGHQPRMVPLAAMLADRIEATAFVASFAVEGGYYLCAVRDDQILPGFERLVSDADEARDAFCELYYGSQWSTAIAPKDWPLEGTLNTSLDELLSGATCKTSLSSVSQRGAVLKLALLMLVLGGGIGGYLYYDHLEQVRIAEEERVAAEVALAEAEREAERRRAMIVIPPYPWEGRNLGMPVMVACVDAILSAPLSVPGWKPVAITCADSAPADANSRAPVPTVTMTLARDGGSLNWVAASLNRGDFRPQVRLISQSQVDVTWQATAGTTFDMLDKDSETNTVGEILRHLVSHFEENFLSFEQRVENGPTIQRQNPQGQPVTEMLSRSLVFSFRTGHDPKEYARILAPIRAMTMNSVKLDLGSWTWSIEGTAHERIPVAGLPARRDAPPRR